MDSWKITKLPNQHSGSGYYKPSKEMQLQNGLIASFSTNNLENLILQKKKKTYNIRKQQTRLFESVHENLLNMQQISSPLSLA